MSADAAPGPALSPVAGHTRREEVTARVRRAVLSGELAPGQRITESWLAQALGVSRPTLRESLQQLVHEGVLVQVPHRGIHVADPTPAELREVAQVRVALETLAALALARDPSGPAMVAVRRALDAHLAAIEEGDDVATDGTHLELHRRVWEGAGNAMLTRIWPLVASPVHVVLTLDQAVLHDPARDAELHRRLVRVIEEGDPAAITREVEEHILHSVDQVIAALDAPGPGTPPAGRPPGPAGGDRTPRGGTPS